MPSPEQPEIPKTPEDLFKDQAEKLKDNLGTLEKLDPPGEKFSPEVSKKFDKICDFLEKHQIISSMVLAGAGGGMGGGINSGQFDSEKALYWGAASAAVVGGWKILERELKRRAHKKMDNDPRYQK